jgi:hypothetical protein
VLGKLTVPTKHLVLLNVDLDLSALKIYTSSKFPGDATMLLIHKPCFRVVFIAQGKVNVSMTVPADN